MEWIIFSKIVGQGFSLAMNNANINVCPTFIFIWTLTGNRWWNTDRVDLYYLKPYKRNLFKKLVDYLGTRQILVLYGFYAEKFSEPEFLGRLMGNLLVINTDAEFFWRQGNYEIDLILKDNTPAELKYQDRVTNDAIKPIIKFCTKYKIKRAVILRHNLLDSSRIENIEIFFIPLWLYLLREW